MYPTTQSRRRRFTDDDLFYPPTAVAGGIRIGESRGGHEGPPCESQETDLRVVPQSLLMSSMSVACRPSARSEAASSNSKMWLRLGNSPGRMLSGRMESRK